MPVSAKTLKVMMDAGLSGDALLAVVSAVDAEMDRSPPATPAASDADERRRAFDRERQANRRAHEKMMRDQSQVDFHVDSPCGQSADKKGSPLPLRDNQTPTSLPKSSLRSELSRAAEAAFEPRFYNLAPRKAGRDAARKAYVRIVSTGRSTIECIESGVVRWASEMAETETKFIAHPASWLNRGGFDDEPAAKPFARAGPIPRRSGGRTVAELAAMNLDEPDCYDEPRTYEHDEPSEGSNRADEGRSGFGGRLSKQAADAARRGALLDL